MRHRDRARGALLLAAMMGAAACGGQGREAAPAAQTQVAMETRAAAQPAAATAPADAPLAVVYKSPTCGCCQKWVEILRADGFRVEERDTADVQPIKEANHLPGHLASCHTAIVDGYVVEGHVPPDVIRRMLRERPRIAGIAVPRMPMGSPGMEAGGQKDPYDVVAFTENGQTSVYESR